jgi:hypothetical protein
MGFDAGPIDFVGTVHDLEDASSALELRWIATPADSSQPTTVFGTNTTAATATLSGVGLPPHYTVTFRATDSGGRTAETSIRFLILSSPVR